MSEEDPKKIDDEGADRDADRAAILERRQRFVRAALATMAAGAVSSLVACGDSVMPQPCLRAAPDSSMNSDSAPQPCLGAPAPDIVSMDATPVPCLDMAPPEDAGEDAMPQACLRMAPTDSGLD
ncbi:MAG: hypothetical protein Q8Q09_03460 [Deltaproteobacteria bacterium]|nr:hypothetical protein [Deltaproteobacteria bacterium]